MATATIAVAKLVEGFGIKKHTEKYADYKVKININKKIESLNISNSTAIVFHHIKKNNGK